MDPNGQVYLCSRCKASNPKAPEDHLTELECRKAWQALASQAGATTNLELRALNEQRTSYNVIAETQTGRHDTVVMTEREMFPANLTSSAADVLVASLGEEFLTDALAVATDLRSHGIRVSLYPENAPSM